tara:strand:+ start:156 stop:839 length:684 start_codon:yes stop_codon:yes gene_type:complete
LAKRLTEIQIKEIVKFFIDGKTIDELSEKFLCTKLTIIRNLKKNIDENKYKFLLNKNKSKVLNSEKSKNSIHREIVNELENVKSDKLSKKSENNLDKNQKNDFYTDSTFMEIVPMDYEINNETQKDLSSISITEVEFPKIVYLIVENKIELQTKNLRDYRYWQFLSQNELDRKTIEIFFDLKIAKGFCNKEQKVIKVPNTDVFRIVAPILVSRGISRLVCPDKLISL